MLQTQFLGRGFLLVLVMPCLYAVGISGTQIPIILTFNPLSNALLLLYFAEIEMLNVSESISIRIGEFVRNVSLKVNYSATEVMFNFAELPSFPRDFIFSNITLSRASNGGPGPFINAFEYYQLITTELATYSADVDALAALKKQFELNDWISDSCFALPWEGIQCNNGRSSVRVLEIKLAGRNLTGSIPTVLAQMTEIISMKFRRKEIANEDAKGSALGTKSVYIHEDDYSMVLVPNPSKSRVFTLEELMKATENFSCKIGQGGFGSVFWGKLEDGKQIAVKVLSVFSRQGVQEFLNEIDLLARVHHKNLVSLPGYCNQSRELMLVYEYMLGGSLKDRLYGQNPNLDWKTRLNIALDAAQGLEYLHVCCTPKIIHRDIKTANILLDDNLNGKPADFGLSRVTIDGEASHVTTTVKGTAGYLEPEYFITHMLTEKSDVYSFGVVLLEIICGRAPIDANVSTDEINIVSWVTPFIEMTEYPQKIVKIVDKRLVDNYSMKSIAHVAKLAIRCVADNPLSRPNASEILVEMKTAVQYHAARLDISEEIDIDYQDQQISPVFLSDCTTHCRDIDSTDSSSNFSRRES